jgi:poly-gamma-glutamate biosynthesis protein PgsC/CapC
VHDYLLSVEIVRFAFIAGVAVSMMLYERRHLTTGSIVVPGYLAIFLIFPSVIVATIANAFISYAFVNKVLPRWFLLYGRTKFTVLAVVSISIQAAMLKLSPSGPWLWENDVPLFVGVGYVIPALIAHDMGRQGIAKTMKSIALAAVLVATPIIVALLAHVPGVNDLSPLEGFGATHVAASWIPVAILLSAAASWGVATNYGLRAGGFVGAAFVAVFTADPWQIALAIGGAVVTYVLVTMLLMPRLILFGRRKFATMLMLSSLLTWTTLWFGDEVLSISVSNHMRVSSLALTPLFLPGLLANDMQRTSPRRVLLGLALAAAFVLATTWWMYATVHRLDEPLAVRFMSIVLFAFIFWPQLTTRPRARAAALAARARQWSRRPARVPVVALDAFYAQPLLTAAASTAAVVMPGVAVVAWSTHGYQQWRERHRAEAFDAERWLEAELAQPADRPRPAPVARSTSPNHSRALDRFSRFELTPAASR